MKAQLATSLVLLSLLCPSAFASENSPLTLTIRGHETVTVGDPVLVDATFKNISNHVIRGFWSGEEFTVSIHDESGQELKPSPVVWGRIGSPPQNDLQPGKEIWEFSVRIDGRYNLQPGRYIVQLARHTDINDPRSPIIKSNEITITVVASAKQRVSQ
jgi:hypothetical protein